MAFLIPFAFVLLCFVKKLTVIGIIGKTHGVSNAANPDKKAMKKIDHNPLCLEGFVSRTGTFSGVTTCSLFASVFVTTVSTLAEFIVVKSVAIVAISAAFEAAGMVNVKLFSILIQTSLQT